MIFEYKTLTCLSTICHLHSLNCLLLCHFLSFLVDLKARAGNREQYGVFARACCCDGHRRFKPVVSLASGDFVLVLHHITCAVCRVSHLHPIDCNHIWIQSN